MMFLMMLLGHLENRFTGGKSTFIILPSKFPKFSPFILLHFSWVLLSFSLSFCHSLFTSGTLFGGSIFISLPLLTHTQEETRNWTHKYFGHATCLICFTFGSSITRAPASPLFSSKKNIFHPFHILSLFVCQVNYRGHL